MKTDSSVAMLRKVAAVHKAVQPSFEGFHAKLDQREDPEPLPWKVGALSIDRSSFEIRYLGQTLQVALIVRLPNVEPVVTSHLLDERHFGIVHPLGELKFLDASKGMINEEHRHANGMSYYPHIDSSVDSVMLMARFFIRAMELRETPPPAAA